MSLSHRIAGRAETLSNLVVAVVLSAVLAADTAVTAARHDNWVFELTVGAIVGALALLRGRGRVLAAGASLAVAAAAAAAGDAAHLPSQPGVAAALPLLVLGAAAVRVAGRRAAVLIAISGVVVMVAGRVTLRPEYIAPASLGVLVWLGALGLGVWLRLLDARRHWRSTLPVAASDWNWPGSCMTSSPTMSPASSSRPRPPGSSRPGARRPWKRP